MGFGRKIRLHEVEGGIISRYAVLEQGGGRDQPCLPESLANHRRQFGRAPHLLTGGRGLASAANERLAKEAGVRRAALSHVGKAPSDRLAEQRGRVFKDASRFRAGIEGRIHTPRRGHGLDRCRYRGERGFGRWVGWGVLSHKGGGRAGSTREGARSRGEAGYSFQFRGFSGIENCKSQDRKSQKIENP